MKIALFILDLGPGGAQGVFVNLVNYLYKQHYDIEVVVQKTDGAVYLSEIDAGIPITSLHNVSTKKAIGPIANFLSVCRPDLVLAFAPELAINLLIAKMLTRQHFKIIGRCMNTISQEYQHAAFFRKHITSTIMRLLYHKIDHAVAQSEGMKDDLVKNWGFKDKQVTVINNAMQPAYEEESLREVSRTRENTLLFVGRLEEQKGLPLLLRAFAQMQRKDVTLKIVGNGSLKTDLQKQAQALSIADRVVFIEHSRQIMPFYQHAHATVLSSYFEGFPNVLIESIACGTPVVSFDLPSGPSEIIQQNINGLLVPYLDVPALAKAMDDALNRTWDENAIRQSAQRYRRETLLSRYTALIGGI